MSSPAGVCAGVCALTGANGYVGGILRRALEAENWRVVAFSRSGTEGTIPWSLDPGSLDPGSLDSTPTSDPDTVKSILERNGVSVLVHAAWDLRLTRPRDLERVNIEGSLRLFAAARAAGIERIVFISTISAYPGARSEYGRTKLAVERHAGVVLRPGLVYGPRPGGMFGALRAQTGGSSRNPSSSNPPSSNPWVPLIGDGSYPQFLVHQDDLAAGVLRAVSMEQAPNVPVTLAHPQPWPFRALMQEIARSQGKTPHFVPIPWRFVYSSLKLAEILGHPLGFRSDSVISLVFQNPHPDWNAALLGVEPRPFTAAGEGTC